ncbi:MAG: hypothetical protein ACFFDF_13710 [Candidatus Odinarchaeota archaeon]
MIEDLLIFNEAGALLYNWHAKGLKSEGNDDLLSGFLTAINSFATIERGEDIKSLKMKETQIIFEKYEELYQKLTFVLTTKNEEIIELLHAIIHDIMDKFIEMFFERLNKEFNGLVSPFQVFDNSVNLIFKSHGLDVLSEALKNIDNETSLKATVYLEPKGGNIYYIYAKQYVNKEKISFLIPLIMNSAKLLYQNNLNEKLYWILLNTVRNETLVVEPRSKVLIVKQYQLPKSFEEDYLKLDFFKEKDKYVKKPRKLIEIFEKINWNPNIKQIYLVDIVGKIFYSKIIDQSYNCSEYIPETISFLTSSKKVSEEIYNRTLFNASIGGESLATICMNFNNFALTLIGKVQDFSNYTIIQNTCLNIFQQIK